MGTGKFQFFAAIFLRRFHADQFATVSCKFLELTEIFQWDKGTSDKIKLVEVCNPFGIFFVRFLALIGFDIFSMCKAHIDIMFKIIKNRNPELSDDNIFVDIKATVDGVF